MNADKMTDEQILEVGLKALTDSLGPVGMVRFIHQFNSGEGDYTKERHKWLGQSTVRNLAGEINKKVFGKRGK